MRWPERRAYWLSSGIQIGIITISDQGPGQSMAKMPADGRQDFPLRLHYAAAGPWTLAGVSCIAFGLRGPTLNLTMEPRDGVPVALGLCAGWLARRLRHLSWWRAAALMAPAQS